MKWRLRTKPPARYEAVVFWMLLLGTFAAFSLTCLVWQWLAAVRFPLHQRVAREEFAPPITVLKPLKGADEHTFACLRSWVEQDYAGEVQVLFGVSSLKDPASRVVEELQRLHPERELMLVECDELLGANAKASKLVHLVRLARHEILVVSDADVLAPLDLLANLVPPLADEDVGLVNCFYRLANPSNLAMRWEAVSTNADFWSQALQGRTIGAQDFALGAVMATRKTEVRQIGGFGSLVDHLADDFQLGNRIALAGGRIEMCPVVVECWDPAVKWKVAWAHQVRWQRTIRVCKPLPYALSIVANPLLWPLLLAIGAPSPFAVAVLLIASALRVAVTGDLLRRFNPGSWEWAWCWLAPLKDACSVLLWIVALGGNRLHWRGVTYLLERDGRLVRESDESSRTGR